MLMDGSRESREMVNAVEWGSWLLMTICGREYLLIRVGERGAHINPLRQELNQQPVFGIRLWGGDYLVHLTMKAIFSVVTSSAAMMRSPSFSRLVESRTTMNSPRPVFAGCVSHMPHVVFFARYGRD